MSANERNAMEAGDGVCFDVERVWRFWGLHWVLRRDTTGDAKIADDIFVMIPPLMKYNVKLPRSCL